MGASGPSMLHVEYCHFREEGEGEPGLCSFEGWAIAAKGWRARRWRQACGTLRAPLQLAAIPPPHASLLTAGCCWPHFCHTATNTRQWVEFLYTTGARLPAELTQLRNGMFQSPRQVAAGWCCLANCRLLLSPSLPAPAVPRPPRATAEDGRWVFPRVRVPLLPHQPSRASPAILQAGQAVDVSHGSAA